MRTDATDVLAPVGAEGAKASGLDPTVGSRSTRTVVGLAGQYALLVVLAFIVLAPIYFTVVQAMSVPSEWVSAGKPLHPVFVDWKDRTWFTGGPVSVVLRTLLVVAFLAWLQRVSAEVPWSAWRRLLTPRKLVAIVGGTVALALLSSAAFQSLHAADGTSQWWVLAAVLAVGLAQAVGFSDDEGRTWRGSVASGLGTGLVLVGFVVVAVGAEVWTRAWTSGDLGPAMQRSFTMAIIITVAQVVTSILAAYAFVFLRFPFKRTLFALFLATLLLPLEVTLIGNIAMIRQLEWINTMQALVLPFGATALGTFLIRQGFRGIPADIQDATRLDGYGHLAFMWKFAVPLSRPVIASFTVISALGAWNQYLWPRSIIQDDSLNTLQIQLRQNVAENIAQANLTIAAALVAAVPVALLLVAFQRQIIRGLTAGAVK
jgi:sn-glycerol 3-phosphate transport system permease protein